MSEAPLERQERQDDIDILYVLGTHRSSTCILYIDGCIYQLFISHILGEPIRDLIEATICMVRGISVAEFTWWAEPGGYRWTLKKDLDRHHRVIIMITELPLYPQYSTASETTLVEFEVGIFHFSALVYCQMKKIEILLKDKSFGKDRSGCFPYPEFRKLGLEIDRSEGYSAWA
jgi:hypothetical protein